jgi:uncharacterized membrane-anchored protein
MKDALKKVWDIFLYHREWTLAVPFIILFLLAVALLTVWLQNAPYFPGSLTEDVGMIVKYAIRGVGLVLAFSTAGYFKTWLAGDVDENTCNWKTLLVDSLTLWIFVYYHYWVYLVLRFGFNWLR